jgi:hypothetical protein
MPSWLSFSFDFNADFESALLTSVKEVVSAARQAAPCLQASKLLMNGSTSDDERRDTASKQPGKERTRSDAANLRGVLDSIVLISISRMIFFEVRSIALKSIILLLLSTINAADEVDDSREKEGVKVSVCASFKTGKAIAR